LWVHNFWQLALLPGFIHIANGDFRGGDFLNFGLDQRWGEAQSAEDSLSSWIKIRGAGHFSTEYVRCQAYNPVYLHMLK